MAVVQWKECDLGIGTVALSLNSEAYFSCVVGSLSLFHSIEIRLNEIVCVNASETSMCDEKSEVSF